MKGIFAATGQTCFAGSRVLVHEEIREEFVERLTDQAGEIALGDPLGPDTEMGPVAFREQWEKVREYVEIGTGEGATLAFGGEQPGDLPGECFIQPTVLVDVESGMQVAQEEIFGPVASVMGFADEEEALELRTTSITGSRRASGRRTPAAPSGWPTGSTRAPSGSTSTGWSRPSRLSAGSKIAASAARTVPRA